MKIFSAVILIGCTVFSALGQTLQRLGVSRPAVRPRQQKVRILDADVDRRDLENATWELSGDAAVSDAWLAITNYAKQVKVFEKEPFSIGGITLGSYVTNSVRNHVGRHKYFRYDRATQELVPCNPDLKLCNQRPRNVRFEMQIGPTNIASKSHYASLVTTPLSDRICRIEFTNDLTREHVNEKDATVIGAEIVREFGRYGFTPNGVEQVRECENTNAIFCVRLTAGSVSAAIEISNPCWETDRFTNSRSKRSRAFVKTTIADEGWLSQAEKEFSDLTNVLKQVAVHKATDKELLVRCRQYEEERLEEKGREETKAAIRDLVENAAVANTYVAISNYVSQIDFSRFETFEMGGVILGGRFPVAEWRRPGFYFDAEAVKIKPHSSWGIHPYSINDNMLSREGAKDCARQLAIAERRAPAGVNRRVKKMSYLCPTNVLLHRHGACAKATPLSDRIFQVDFYDVIDARTLTKQDAVSIGKHVIGRLKMQGFEISGPSESSNVADTNVVFCASLVKDNVYAEISISNPRPWQYRDYVEGVTDDAYRPRPTSTVSLRLLDMERQYFKELTDMTNVLEKVEVRRPTNAEIMEQCKKRKQEQEKRDRDEKQIKYEWDDVERFYSFSKPKDLPYSKLVKLNPVDYAGFCFGGLAITNDMTFVSYERKGNKQADFAMLRTSATNALFCGCPFRATFKNSLKSRLLYEVELLSPFYSREQFMACLRKVVLYLDAEDGGNLIAWHNREITERDGTRHLADIKRTKQHPGEITLRLKSLFDDDVNDGRGFKYRSKTVQGGDRAFSYCCKTKHRLNVSVWANSCDNIPGSLSNTWRGKYRVAITISSPDFRQVATIEGDASEWNKAMVECGEMSDLLKLFSEPYTRAVKWFKSSQAKAHQEGVCLDFDFEKIKNSYLAASFVVHREGSHYWEMPMDRLSDELRNELQKSAFNVKRVKKDWMGERCGVDGKIYFISIVCNDDAAEVFVCNVRECGLEDGALNAGREIIRRIRLGNQNMSSEQLYKHIMEMLSRYVQGRDKLDTSSQCLVREPACRTLRPGPSMTEVDIMSEEAYKETVKKLIDEDE